MPPRFANGPLVLLTLLCAALPACSRDPVALKAGAREIRRSDLRAREKIVRLYFPEYSGDAAQAARKQLTDAFVAAEILDRHGLPVTTATLQAEADRIEKGTLMPEKLKAIQAIFGDDRDAYLRDYVLPVYVDRVLYYEVFLHDPRIQAPSLERARALLEELRVKGGSFRDRPRELPHFRFSVSRERGVEIESPKPEEAPSAAPASGEAETRARNRLVESGRQGTALDAERWLREIVATLKPGEVFGQVIDQNERWWIVRYLGQARGKSRFEGIALPKLDYAAWLERERSGIPLSN